MKNMYQHATPTRQQLEAAVEEIVRVVATRKSFIFLAEEDEKVTVVGVGSSNQMQRLVGNVVANRQHPLSKDFVQGLLMGMSVPQSS